VSLLNLASFREERIEETDHQLSILVSTKSVPDGCCLLPALVRNGTKRIMFRDLPIHGKQVAVWVERQRYACRICHKTLYQPLPAVSESH